MFCLTFFLLLDPAEGTAEGLSMEAEVGWGATLVVAGAGKDSGTGCKVGVRILLVTGTRIQEHGHSKLLFRLDQKWACRILVKAIFKQGNFYFLRFAEVVTSDCTHTHYDNISWNISGETEEVHS